jgi:hypothetical protein
VIRSLCLHIGLSSPSSTHLSSNLLLLENCSSSMFSFLSSTFVVSKVGTPKPTLLFRPTTWRFFSQSYTIYAEHEDPIAPKLRMDERNIRRREKYHNDQAFREKELARFRSRIRNPLYRDKIKDSAKLRYENWRDHNPEAFQRWIVKSCLLAARLRASDPRYNFSKALHNLLVSDGNAWAREELPWKTHVPVLYPEKVYRKCARCDRRPQKGGLKLWYVCGEYNRL